MSKTIALNRYLQFKYIHESLKCVSVLIFTYQQTLARRIYADCTRVGAYIFKHTVINYIKMKDNNLLYYDTEHSN